MRQLFHIISLVFGTLFAPSIGFAQSSNTINPFSLLSRPTPDRSANIYGDMRQLQMLSTLALQRAAHQKALANQRSQNQIEIERLKLEQLKLKLQLQKQANQPQQSGNLQRGVDAATRGDYGTALREWKPLAEQGHPAATMNIGVLYENGWGVEKDYKTAGGLYVIASKGGHYPAQTKLALLYAKGLGFPKDYQLAVQLANSAAKHGDNKAQGMMGWFYEYGNGVPKNHQEAIKWYRLAANSGNSEAISPLNSLLAKIK